MKLLAVLFIPLLLAAFFLFQGVKSARMVAPKITAGKLPLCGTKPNCVCSEQSPTDAGHYITPLALNSHTISSIATVVESLGGKVVSQDTNTLHATFTSRVFRFVDDLLLRIDSEQIHIRSSSRVGHSDIGANRKRLERMRAELN